MEKTKRDEESNSLTICVYLCDPWEKRQGEKSRKACKLYYMILSLITKREIDN